MSSEYIYHYCVSYAGGHLAGVVQSEKILDKNTYVNFLGFIEKELNEKKFVVLSLTMLHKAE